MIAECPGRPSPLDRLHHGDSDTPAAAEFHSASPVHNEKKKTVTIETDLVDEVGEKI